VAPEPKDRSTYPTDFNQSFVSAITASFYNKLTSNLMYLGYCCESFSEIGTNLHDDGEED
jgi:hypothetical protein